MDSRNTTTPRRTRWWPTIPLVAGGLLLGMMPGTAEAQCDNYPIQYPATTMSPVANAGFVAINGCNYAGEYATVNVVAGDTYIFSTCAADGSDVTYDSQLTLRDGAGLELAYDDDGCGSQSRITWEATYTGVVEIHLNEFLCASNTTCSMIMVSRSNDEGPPEVPANDDCANVTPEALAVGGSVTFTGTTDGATAAGDGVFVAAPAVWHAFTLSECATVTLSYCGTLPAYTSTYTAVTMECPAAAAIGGVSDWDFCGNGNNHITFVGLEAGTYYFPVAFVAGAAQGAYSIEVSAAACPEPAPCLDAPNGQYPAAAFTPACSGTVEPMVTDAWTGEYSMVSLTAGEEYIFSSSVSSHWITISDATGTTALAYGTTPVSFTPAANGDYRFYTHLSALCNYANVFHARQVQCGDIPEPPANDDCANTTPLTVGAAGTCPANAVEGTTTGATGGGETPSCLIDGLVDVHYTFNSGTATQVVWNIELGTMSAIAVQVLDACNGNEVYCNGDLVNGLIPVTPGTDYILRVLTLDFTQGTFTICLEDGSALTCPAGEIQDCNGNCFPANWLGDGDCDNGQWSYNGIPIVLNCEELDWDNGDCDPNGPTCTAVAPDCVLSDDAAYQTVIANDAWCCNNTWDGTCQNAFDLISDACLGVCAAVAPDCVLSDEAAYQAVIAGDDWCCNNNWDGLCQDDFDAISDACAVPCEYDLVLELQTDDYAYETSWAIIDDGTGATVCSGSGYPDNAIVTATCCVAEGCYRLEVYDEYGDGMSLGGGDWDTGGYILRTVDGERIIDNAYNFSAFNGSGFGDTPISTLAPGESFCLPLGEDRPIHTSCDRFWWTSGNYLVAAENPAVSAQFGVTNATSGYEFWFFDPNGQDDYSFRKFRNHATSDGFSPNNAVRAAHIKLNNWAAANHLQNYRMYNVRIRGVIDGDELPYGPACRVVLDPEEAACTPTGLNDIIGHPNFSCGVSRTWGANSTANRVYARSVGGANKYEFEFSNPGEGYLAVVQSNTVIRHLNWSSQPPLNVGSIYQVRVRASKDGGATWCNWGWTCDVTIAPGVAPGGESFALEGTGVSLWPNPNNGQQLWMEIDGLTDDIRTIAVDIHDLSGKRVIAREVAAQHGALQLDLNGDLAAGTYLVTITAGDQRHVERLVIAD